VIEPKSTFSMAIHGWRLFSGSIDQMPGVKRFQAQKVRVEREMSGYYQFDGEALDGAAELTFSVKKRALSVLVPKGQ